MSSSASASRKKWALLIGINVYPGLSERRQLKGCVNDMRVLGQVLRERFGFPDENVTLLTDGEATRDGILAGLDALAGRVGEDDVVVVGFAGHGSQVTDIEGDEPDGFDETLVPSDASRSGGANVDITDDEINAWLLRVSATTPYLTFLVDCCHSGTITRDLIGAQTRYLEPDYRPAAELGRAPSPASTRGEGTPAGPSGWLPLSERYVLIAGCRDEECSYEHQDPESGVTHGALSFFLSRALAEVTPGTTYRDVFERVRPSVTALYPYQHPQMEGAIDREVFGVSDVAPMRFVGVEARDGQTVTLAAGAAQGLTLGTVLDIYPPGTKTPDGTAALGRVRVTRVRALASEAEVTEEATPGAIGVGARAVEVQHGLGTPGLGVALDGPEAEAAFGDAVEGSPVLRRAPGGAPADIHVVHLAPRDAVAEGDRAPQLGPLAVATWAALGADGRLVCPAHPDTPGGTTAIADNLETVARYRAALALDNPDPHSPLRGAVEVTLKRRGPGGWVDAEPELAGGEVVFVEGEQLAFTVTNRHPEPLYIYALDFGLAGAVNPLTIPGANEALAPEGTMWVPDGAAREGGEGFAMSFPARFPFAPEPGTAAPVEGTETLKVFATTQPADFSALRQGGVRSVATADGSSLTALLEHTFQRAPMRDMTAPASDADPDDWTAVSRTFVLRRAVTGAALDASGEGISVGSVVIRSKGLEGRARALPPPDFSERTRSVEQTTDAFDDALSHEGLRSQGTIEIQSVRSRGLGDEEIEVEVPAVDDAGQVLLAVDESGVASWRFPEPEAPRTRGGATHTFRIPGAGPAPEGGPATRSLLGAVGSKLLKMLVFPLVDPLIGRVGEYYAGRWEAVRRPYGLRAFTPEGFQAEAPPLDPSAWGRLSEGRALLFVHGTFSRAHSAFGGLSPEVVAELHRRYEGRVFAFDHMTLSEDPEANVRWLAERLPEGAALDLDVVTHSRGGLVGRVLAERQSALSLGSRSLAVRSMVFVASPNGGTHLADPQHMGDLVDSYTNLLNFVPGGAVTDVLEGVVTVAKQLAVGALGGLAGLQSMRPGGDFQSALNTGDAAPGTRYLALGADFAPTEPGFKAWAMSRLTQSVFGADNDLVVPTASVYAANGSGRFPIEERHVFTEADGVAHSTFFQHPAVREKLLEWLRP